MVSHLLETHFYIWLAAFPAILGLVGLGLSWFGENLLTVAILLFIWGYVSTAAQVAWWTWLSKALPEDAEKGGGMMVAVTQLGITCGAVIGGAVFDTAGPAAEFTASGIILLLAARIALGL